MRFSARLRKAALAFAVLGFTTVAARADGATLPPGATLTRQFHQMSGIFSLAWSPDGRRIGVGDTAGVKIRDAETGALVAAFPLTTVKTTSVAFTPDSKAIVELDYYVSEFADMPTGYGAVIDIASGKQKALTLGVLGEAEGQTVSVSPDGKTVAVTMLGSNTAGLYRRADGAQLHTLPLPPPDDFGVKFNEVKFSPDGQWVIALTDDGAIRLFDPASGKQRRKIKPSAGFAPSVLTLAGKDALLAEASGGDIQLLAASDGKKIAALQGGKAAPPIPPDAGFAVTSVAASLDATVLASTDGKFGVRVWARSDSKLVWQFIPENQPVSAIAVAPDGREIAIAQGTALKVFSLPEGKLKYEKDGGSGFRALRFEPDGAAFSAFSEDGALRRWDIATGRLLTSNSLDAAGEMSAFNGRLAVVGDREKSATVFDAESGKAIASVPVAPKAEILALALSPDSHILALADRQTAEGTERSYGVTLYGLPEGKALKILPDEPDLLQALAFSADGRALLVGYGPGRVRIFDVTTGKALANTQTGDEGDIYGVHAVAGLADGHAYAVRNDFNLQLREFPGGKQLVSIKAAYNENAFDVSKDGHRLAIAGNPVEIWQANGRKPERAFASPEDEVDALAFSPDGKKLLIGDAGGAIRLYDAESGALLATFYAAGSDWAALAADGRFVASGDLGAFVRPTRASELLPMESLIAANRRESLR